MFMLSSRMTLFNNNLGLFEKNQFTEDCIRFNEKLLEESKKHTGEHELVGFVEAYRKR